MSDKRFGDIFVRVNASRAPRGKAFRRVAACALVTYLDWPAIERKWQARWREARLFEASADPSRPKWYANVPYPYMSGRQHIGFGYSFLRAEIAARYRRMRGFNVLLPQAFHCTGLPILGAAKRVAAKDPTQLETLRTMGIPEEDIPKFADPLHWIRTFPRETMEDLQALGAAVDWRRSFVTTSHNPPYDAFVRWQFRRLKEGGYVRLGRHPVIWCPNDQAPIGDHDRLKGDGETPVEFTLLKFPAGEFTLVAATLRPETVFGQTNLWVDPAATYVVADVDGERLVMSALAVTKLSDQGHAVRQVSKVPGASLLGKTVRAPMIHRDIPILPGTFLDQAKGTGIVTSVPSDAPDDWIALEDLRRDGTPLTRHGVDLAVIDRIAAIPIIRSEGWGELPAKEICERLGVQDQNDRGKLEKAKEEIYKTGFYTGVMRENCGPYAGQKVETAKEAIKAELLRSGEALTLHEPSGTVVCRCGATAHVKVVADQWFLAYGDEAWKAKAREMLRRMRLYPEQVRGQLEHVIDWLRDWACVHHHGLGTALPWEKGWVIESLSDSTIYMAYYTLAHILQGGELQSQVPWASRLDDAFFDFVISGMGDASSVAATLGVDVALLDDLRREFTYWYPFDLRNSGKDLVHNHMVFFLFTHAALFPEDQWPKGMGVNGFVSLSGEKMSKSRGNVVLLRDVVRDLGADVTRITAANGAEGLDDPNFDFDFAATIQGRLRAWFAYATERHDARDDWTAADDAFRSALNRALEGTIAAMEDLNHRTAIKRGFFDLQAAWDWYVQRSSGVPHRSLLERYLDAQTLVLAPFVPHLAEEAWESRGKTRFASAAPYPQPVPAEIDTAAEATEEYVRAVLEDVRAILKVTAKRIEKPSSVRIITAPSWKSAAMAVAVKHAPGGRLDMKAFMAQALADPVLKAHAGDLPDFAKRAASALRGPSGPLDEAKVLWEATDFLSRSIGSAVIVQAATPDLEATIPKAKQAMPGRPAIMVE